MSHRTADTPPHAAATYTSLGNASLPLLLEVERPTVRLFELSKSMSFEQDMKGDHFLRVRVSDATWEQLKGRLAITDGRQAFDAGYALGQVLNIDGHKQISETILHIASQLTRDLIEFSNSNLQEKKRFSKKLQRLHDHATQKSTRVGIDLHLILECPSLGTETIFVGPQSLLLQEVTEWMKNFASHSPRQAHVVCTPRINQERRPVASTVQRFATAAQLLHRGELITQVAKMTGVEKTTLRNWMRSAPSGSRVPWYKNQRDFSGELQRLDDAQWGYLLGNYLVKGNTKGWIGFAPQTVTSQTIIDTIGTTLSVQIYKPRKPPQGKGGATAMCYSVALVRALRRYTKNGQEVPWTIVCSETALQHLLIAVLERRSAYNKTAGEIRIELKRRPRTLLDLSYVFLENGIYPNVNLKRNFLSFQGSALRGLIEKNLLPPQHTLISSPPVIRPSAASIVASYDKFIHRARQPGTIVAQLCREIETATGIKRATVKSWSMRRPHEVCARERILSSRKVYGLPDPLVMRELASTTIPLHDLHYVASNATLEEIRRNMALLSQAKLDFATHFSNLLIPPAELEQLINPSERSGRVSKESGVSQEHYQESLRNWALAEGWIPEKADMLEFLMQKAQPFIESTYRKLCRRIKVFRNLSAEELHSAAGVRIIQDLPTLNTESETFEDFVRLRARRGMHNEYRAQLRNGRLRTLQSTDDDQTFWEAGIEDNPPTSAPPADHDTLEQIAAQMPPREGRVYLWKYRDGLFDAQIAERLNCHKNTARALFKKAKQLAVEIRQAPSTIAETKKTRDSSENILPNPSMGKPLGEIDIAARITAGMPPQMRQIFLLKFNNGLSLKEIATFLKMTLREVRQISKQAQERAIACMSNC